MENDLEACILSRPVYRPVEVDKRSTFHLFIGQAVSVTLSEKSSVKIIADTPKKLNQLYESCSYLKHKIIFIASDVHYMNSELQACLLTAPVNTRVYIDGTESFLWLLAKQLNAFGVAIDQISMIKPENKQRNIYCVHCNSITHAVKASPAHCFYCQRNLFVTDHFSKRHGAYQAYQVNAEEPDEIPIAQELM
jgi:hypothetical protein